MIIGIDFDGTVVEHEYPHIGPPVPGALDRMREWLKDGHLLILWTIRSGKHLDDAVKYLKAEGILLFGVNQNPDQASWSKSPKAYCNVFIDDAAYGCPLVYPEEGRPYADWSKIILPT